ncbi:MAG TPA: hypothetical protein DIW64_20625 [Cellvibrio sp.]|nr:hypothetical protein [Cellvibrio sp.]
MFRKLLVLGITIFTSIICNAKNIAATTLDKTYKDLVKNSEVIFISGYTTKVRGKNVKVVVNCPNKNIVLVLTSYDKVDWEIEASQETKISAIVVSESSITSVNSNTDTIGFSLDVKYAKEIDNLQFRKTVSALNKFLLIEKVSFFRSSYNIPNEIIINSMDVSNDEISVFGIKPERPTRNFNFYLTTSEQKKTSWALDGPEEYTKSTYKDINNIVTISEDEIIYLQNDNEIYYKKLENNSIRINPPPSNFPELKAIKKVAFDSKRNILAVVKNDGMYKYDTNSRKWIDFKLGNFSSIISLCYDEKTDRYIGLSISHKQVLNLHNFDENGDRLFDIEISKQPVGLGELIDEGNPSAPLPTLKLVVEGDDAALIATDDYRVTNVWYLDLRLENSLLTYKVIEQ